MAKRVESESPNSPQFSGLLGPAALTTPQPHALVPVDFSKTFVQSSQPPASFAQARIALAVLLSLADTGSAQRLQERSPWGPKLK